MFFFKSTFFQNFHLCKGWMKSLESWSESCTSTKQLPHQLVELGLCPFHFENFFAKSDFLLIFVGKIHKTLTLGKNFSKWKQTKKTINFQFRSTHEYYKTPSLELPNSSPLREIFSPSQIFGSFICANPGKVSTSAKNIYTWR